MWFSSNSTSWAREQAWAIRGKCLRWDKWSAPAGMWSGEAAVWDLWVKWMRKHLLCNRKGLHCLVLHCSSMLHMLENMSQIPAWSVLGGVCWVTGDRAVRWNEIRDWISSCPEYSERRKQSWLYSSSSVPRAAGDQMNLWKRLHSLQWPSLLIYNFHLGSAFHLCFKPMCLWICTDEMTEAFPLAATSTNTMNSAQHPICWQHRSQWQKDS